MIEKITYQEVLDAVYGETYTILPDKRTTVCQLTLDNGFTVIGLSFTVDVAHFVQELGEEAAKKDAIDKIWMLLAFRKFEDAKR